MELTEYLHATTSHLYDHEGKDHQPKTHTHVLESNDEKSSIAEDRSGVWTPDEIKTLIEALQQYPSDSCSWITRHIKVAAFLADKSVRDVAAKLRVMKLQVSLMTVSWVYREAMSGFKLLPFDDLRHLPWLGKCVCTGKS